MKLRFWQKTYLLTLLLFLICLYAGIFSLAVYAKNRSISETEATAQAEVSYIVLSFERDCNALLSASKYADVPTLMESYGAFYSEKGIFLSFSDTDGKVLCSHLPEEIVPDGIGRVRIERIDGTRFVTVQSNVGDGYVLSYAKDVHELDDQFRKLILTDVAVAAAVSAILACCLLFLLKRLSHPLEKLHSATEKIASGDLSVQADTSGSDEFSALAKSFNAMVVKINEQMEELSEDAKQKQMLVDNMAHELRTPLTSIRGYAEYLEQAAITEEEKIDAAIWIRSEAVRLQKISELILDMACLRNDTPEMKPVSLPAVLRDVAKRSLPNAQSKQVQIVTDLQDCTVFGEETLLSMLFGNLTDNAVKACAPGGCVTISCRDNAVTVTDNGKGMTPEQLSHITEPFYRTDKSRSRAEGGAGLGLTLCKRICEAHGAQMVFSSALKKGTNVTVLFKTQPKVGNIPPVQ